MPMAANKLLLFLTLLSLFSTIALSSSDSIASAPSSSVQGSLNLQAFSSFFFRGFKIGFRGSRKLADGFQRGRIVAETPPNNTTRGLAPAPAPAPAAISANKTLDSKKKDKEKSSAVKWLAGIALGLATGAISAILASLLFRVIHDYWKRPKPSKPVVFRRKIVDAKDFAFLEAADAMESLELLGKGGSGEVYKTTLASGRVVAIKKVSGLANLSNEGGVDLKLEQTYDLTRNSAQIKAELETLGQIRHRNLVALFAYIPLQSAHLLIYDFMENGSLQDALMKVGEGSLELPWETRLNIAKGVATGLKYLHFDCIPKIVHCDLKPGNILLDKDMVAHIGDFGLAKLIPDSFTHFTSKNLAGTVGYIPPEYHQMCRYTTRGDVYGFGVVLVVLLTGKEPTHHLFSDVYTHLGNWLTDVLAAGEESARGVLDPHLCGQGEGDESEMLLALKVASFCLCEDPAKRPTSNDVLKMLEQIRPSSQPYPKVGLPLEAM